MIDLGLPNEAYEDIAWFERADGLVPEPSECWYVTVIKQYHIPKEQFETAVQIEAERRIQWGYDLSEEENELPNADIIYSFDNEIINAYYRRENPVVPEPGTYATYGSYEEYLKAKR